MNVHIQSFIDNPLVRECFGHVTRAAPKRTADMMPGTAKNGGAECPKAMEQRCIDVIRVSDSQMGP